MTPSSGDREQAETFGPGTLPPALALDGLGGAALAPVAAHRLVELLALVAEGARRTLGASSLTISWQDDRQAAPELLASAGGQAGSVDGGAGGVYVLTAEFARPTCGQLMSAAGRGALKGS